MKLKRKTKLAIAGVCAGLIALAYFAWKFPFYEYTRDVYETSAENLLTWDHLDAMKPFFMILLLSAVGIVLCIRARKRIIKSDPVNGPFVKAHTGKARGKLIEQKRSVFMTVRWMVMILSFFGLVYGEILFGVQITGISIPILSCPVNEQQTITSSCYYLAHLDELMALPLKDILIFCLSTLLSLVLLGRVICGFLCPLGLAQDVAHEVRQGLKIEGVSMTERMYRGLVPIKWVMVFLMLGLVFLGGNFCNFCPAITMSPAFAGMKVSLYISGFLMVLLLIGSFFKRRFWCNICPLGYLMGLLYKISLFRVKKDCQACTECGACYEACPMGIKMIYTEREKTDVTDVNCIMCGECVKKCPEGHALALTFAGKEFYTASRKQVMSGYQQKERTKKRKRGEKKGHD